MVIYKKGFKNLSSHERERVLFWPLDSKFRLDMSFSFIFVFFIVISYIQCDNHNIHLHELKQFAEFSSLPIQLFFSNNFTNLPEFSVDNIGYSTQESIS